MVETPVRRDNSARIASLGRFNLWDVLIHLFLLLFAGLAIYPFLNVFAVSLSEYEEYIRTPLMVIPRSIHLRAYAFVFSQPLILWAYRNTLVVTVAGTAFHVVLVASFAYPLARRGLRGKPFFMTYLIITMMFNGGLIPNFYLVRRLGMYNTLLALFVPGAMSAFYVILMKNFIESVPDSLIEAAKIDGASEIFILTRIILPLSTAILATLALFNAVGLWNSFFSAVVYIKDRTLWTLQLLLREIVLEGSQMGGVGEVEQIQGVATQNLKYAVIVATILPILCLYPFLQRYFVKGIMIGAVKG